MSLVRKRRQPFLLLPSRPSLARQVLELYPAQTWRARMVRRGMCYALALRWPLGRENISVPYTRASPFVGFLGDLAGTAAGELPPLGILAGNPNSPGQRLILLIFGADGTPVVVKAGLSERARELIARERDFLKSVTKETAGVPELRAAFTSPQLDALAMDYFPGNSPQAEDEEALPHLLSSWVNREKGVVIAQTRVWRELEGACRSSPFFPALDKTLKARTVRATLCHGDFAPWNIKVSTGGSWAVLDWERAELDGLPGWDWFHYVIQLSILVRHEPTPALSRRVEALLASPEFRQYARLSTISGVERELVLAYLLHHCEVMRPAEGLVAGRDLLDALGRSWLKS